MSGSEQVTMNGLLVWVYVVELVTGLRMRVSLDDWDKLRLYRGLRITVQRGTGRAVPMFLVEVTDVPPVAWIVLANVARAAG